MESKLVVSLDLYDIGKLKKIAAEVGPVVYAIKLNWPSIMIEGAGIIQKISEYSRVICDLKIADIPNTNSLIARKVSELGAWGIISHSFTGSDSLRAVIDSAGKSKVFSVVSMSHPGSHEFLNRFTDDLIEISRSAGAYGLIAPGNNPDMLRHIRSRAGKLIVMTPGIGAQGGSPAEAIASGADLVIVGRSIYESSNPLEEAVRINRDIEVQLSGEKLPK